MKWDYHIFFTAIKSLNVIQQIWLTYPTQVKGFALIKFWICKILKFWNLGPLILFGYLTRIFLNLSITTHSHSYGPVERINPGESCNQYLPGICIMLVLDVRINPNYFRLNSCLQNSDPRVTTNPPSCHARTKSSCKYKYRQV